MKTSTKTLVPATDKQRNFVRNLRDGRELPVEIVDYYTDAFIDEKMTMLQASRAIDGMRGYPFKVKDEVVTAESNTKPVTEEGIYERAGVVYEVKRSGKGFWYAKEFTGEGFVYVGSAPVKKLTAEDKMTKDRASELSMNWGRCLRCHKVLTADESVARSIGPVCIKHFA